ncbi:MAG TPA: TlpA disulfide reductase family protein [Pyrinomonadaceae bacterium]|jgi:thiol-disulfide isomerase/thioredoxin|nr:TlpA disulfide reductase family protein [Pyrinomonadaceae bacterium]
MSVRKNEVKKIRFWTPLRLVTTIIVFGLLVAVAVSSCNSNDPPSKTAARANTANTLPRQVLDAENRAAASGTPIKLANYSGKVMLINLWATWCGPCRMETPELVKLHKEYQTRGVEMIGLSTENPDLSARSVSDFVREFNVDYQIGWAKPELAQIMMAGRTSIPQSFIIARDGHVIRRFIGFNPETTPTQLKEALEQALKEEG